jgi:hypothetical protein
MDDPNYIAVWRKFRFWRRTFFIVFFSWIVYWPAVEAVFGKGVSFWYAAPFTAVWFFAGFKMSQLYCPRCGHDFFKVAGFINTCPFGRRCGSCGLPKFAPCDPNAPLQRHSSVIG